MHEAVVLLSYISSWLTGSQKKVGTLPKDTTSGPFADEWKRAFSEISKDVEEVDITPALSAAFSIKDPDELVSSGASLATNDS